MSLLILGHTPNCTWRLCARTHPPKPVLHIPPRACNVLLKHTQVFFLHAAYTLNHAWTCTQAQMQVEAPWAFNICYRAHGQAHNICWNSLVLEGCCPCCRPQEAPAALYNDVCIPFLSPLSRPDCLLDHSFFNSIGIGMVTPPCLTGCNDKDTLRQAVGRRESDVTDLWS